MSVASRPLKIEAAFRKPFEATFSRSPMYRDQYLLTDPLRNLIHEDSPIGSPTRSPTPVQVTLGSRLASFAPSVHFVIDYGESRA